MGVSMRTPPEKQNPAPLAGGNRAKETIIQLGQHEHKPNFRLHQAARDKLERRTDDLAAIADWRDVLAYQMQHAHLMTPTQFARLECAIAAFAAFTRICDGSVERRAM
jgi:hypothetical protein